MREHATRFDTPARSSFSPRLRPQLVSYDDQENGAVGGGGPTLPRFARFGSSLLRTQRTRNCVRRRTTRMASSLRRGLQGFWFSFAQEVEFFVVGAAVGEDFAFPEQLQHGVAAEGAGLPCSYHCLEFAGGHAGDAE